ncbi:SRSF protein kinase 3 [Daldinia childiae]|uniref:SRSF protein kinase 3 n=1 Tax=Daldinia childiae TaxID=326645 RepID=UPI001446B104|nr:SRSF protein kinase 3 [Daldinia childiae]KAF3064737.1 SRSF protein kinase 3 [Daldinia childiae]
MEILSPTATAYPAEKATMSIRLDATLSDEVIQYTPFYYLANTEDVQMYNKGGYHPVHIGDILDGRFEVVHKLGSGGFGIVWLCRDTLLDKWRAVKIITADHSAKGTEEKIFSYLRDHCSPAELRKNHILLPLEQFSIVGPNGRHSCLVMPVLGSTVENWRMPKKDYEEQTHDDTRDVCGQIVDSMRFLHSHGICHGDFRPANILMEVEGIDDLDRDEILGLMGEPECYNVETVSGQPLTPRAPEYCVTSASEFWCETLTMKSIAIIDFGESFFTATPPISTGIPEIYAAPEVLLRGYGTLGSHSDIWSLACTLFEVRTGSPLFADVISGGFGDAINRFELFLGPLPPNIGGPKTQLDIKDSTIENEPQPDTPKLDEFAEDRACLIEGSGYSDIFEAVLGREQTRYLNLLTAAKTEAIKYRYPKEDVLGLADLLRKMLKYNPEERIGIDTVMSHPWVGKMRKGKAGTDSVDFTTRFTSAAVSSMFVFAAVATWILLNGLAKDTMN